MSSKDPNPHLDHIEPLRALMLVVERYRKKCESLEMYEACGELVEFRERVSNVILGYRPYESIEYDLFDFLKIHGYVMFLDVDCVQFAIIEETQLYTFFFVIEPTEYPELAKILEKSHEHKRD